jgi:hypothetical protein
MESGRLAMTIIEAVVLLTFWMRSRNALRWLALASNVAFFAYGYLSSLPPVLVLHAVLPPVNSYRVAQLYKSSSARTGSERARRLLPWIFAR